MAGLGNIAIDVGGAGKGPATEIADIITFVESSWGLNGKLFPVQRVILKAHYGIPLDNTVKFEITDFRRENPRWMTEVEYLKYLYDEGRCSISEVIPGHERRELVLSIGRRSGKTQIAAFISAYETYKLILKGDPQAYYGLPPGEVIGLLSVATDKNQAGVLFSKVSGYYKECFSGDTEIITDDGVREIGSLAGTTQTILTRNGAWVEAPIRSFGKRRLWEVVLRRQGVNKTIHCTENHRWFARDARKAYRGTGFQEFTTTELRPGKHHLQAVIGKSYKNKIDPSPFGVAHGFTFGDGCSVPGERQSNWNTFYGAKDRYLLPYFSMCPQRQDSKGGVLASALPNYFRDRPSIRENKAYLLGWLMGYFAADGCASGGTPILYGACRSDLEFARDVCVLLGIGTYSIRCKEHVSNMTGQKAVLYSLALMRHTLDESFFLIPDHREAFRVAGGANVSRKVVEWTVVSVRETDRDEEVYCATVAEHEAFALEGNILTGNCPFFAPYTANHAMSYARFQTPKDIERYGRYADNDKANATIRMTFSPCRARGLRGFGNIVVILDEFAHFTDTGQSASEEVYKAVTPSTTAFSPKDPLDTTRPIGPVEGRIICISSPLGRQGQFYKLFQQGFQKDMTNRLCIQAPTWEVNPTVPADEFVKNFLNDPNAFSVEYGGQFSDRTKGWIDNQDDLLACVNPTLKPIRQAPARHPHFAGFDLGLVGDGSAIAICHLDDKQHIVLDYIDQIKAGEGKYANHDKLEFDDVADWVAELARRFYISQGIFDMWSGIPFQQALAKRGLKQFEAVHFTKPLRSEYYKNFKDMMWDKRLVLFDYPKPPPGESLIEHCPYIQELLELQAEYVSMYVTEVKAPKMAGKHDDMSDALVRAVWAASQNISKPTRIAGGRPNQAQRPGSTALNPSAARKAWARSRTPGGSSPDRQPSLLNRGRVRGRL